MLACSIPTHIQIRCPVCDSIHVTGQRSVAKVLGSASFLYGVLYGAQKAMKGGRAGLYLTLSSPFTGAIGLTTGLFTSVFARALWAGLSYGLSGYELGTVIDQHLIKAYRCQHCGARFTFDEQEPAHKVLPTLGLLEAEFEPNKDPQSSSLT